MLHPFHLLDMTVRNKRWSRQGIVQYLDPERDGNPLGLVLRLRLRQSIDSAKYHKELRDKSKNKNKDESRLRSTGSKEHLRLIPDIVELNNKSNYENKKNRHALPAWGNDEDDCYDEERQHELESDQEFFIHLGQNIHSDQPLRFLAHSKSLGNVVKGRPNSSATTAGHRRSVRFLFSTSEIYPKHCNSCSETSHSDLNDMKRHLSSPQIQFEQISSDESFLNHNCALELHHKVFDEAPNNLFDSYSRSKTPKSLPILEPLLEEAEDFEY